MSPLASLPFSLSSDSREISVSRYRNHVCAVGNSVLCIPSGLNFDLHLKGFYTPKRGGIGESFLPVDRGARRRKKILKGRKSARCIQRSLGKWLGKRSANVFVGGGKNIACVEDSFVESGEKA